MKTKTAYYTHSKHKYDTPCEAEEIAFIEKHFKGRVICPNKHSSEFVKLEIRPYIKAIEPPPTVVYATEYLNYVGYGVYADCKFALENNIQVLVVRTNENNDFCVLQLVQIERIEKSTSNFYGRLITKKNSTK